MDAFASLIIALAVLALCLSLSLGIMYKVYESIRNQKRQSDLMEQVMEMLPHLVEMLDLSGRGRPKGPQVH